MVLFIGFEGASWVASGFHEMKCFLCFVCYLCFKFEIKVIDLVLFVACF